MAKKQKIYSNEFKFKVIKDVLRDEMPIIQVANKHNITPKNIYNWRDQFEKKGADIFSSNDPQLETYKVLLKDQSIQIDELHRQLGGLNAQLNWAKKKSNGAANDRT